MAIDLELIKKGFGDIPPVETEDFQHAMSLVRSALEGNADLPPVNSVGLLDLDGKRLAVQFMDVPLNRAILAIADYCDAKFNVTERDPDDERVIKAHELYCGITGRLFCWSEFVGKNLQLLKDRDLVVENTYHRILEDVAAYLPLHSSRGYDPEDVIAEVDRRLGREHVPVFSEPSPPEEEPSVKTVYSLQEKGLLSVKREVPWGGYHKEMEGFVNAFAVARTVFVHIDSATQTATLNEDELHREVNEWLKNNPVLTKEDLACMKQLLRQMGIPKLIWQNLVRDMRGKTFHDLRKAVLQVEEDNFED